MSWKNRINPAMLLRLQGEKEKFAQRHPKFVAFLGAMGAEQFEEGTIFEVTVTRPGQEPVTANLRLLPEDIELIRQMQNPGNDSV